MLYDGQVVDALMYSMRSYGARFIMGEQVDRIDNLGDRAVIHLSTGRGIVMAGRRGGEEEESRWEEEEGEDRPAIGRFFFPETRDHLVQMLCHLGGQASVWPRKVCSTPWGDRATRYDPPSEPLGVYADVVLCLK